jgi:hypothetical protein
MPRVPCNRWLYEGKKVVQVLELCASSRDDLLHSLFLFTLFGHGYRHSGRETEHGLNGNTRVRRSPTGGPSRRVIVSRQEFLPCKRSKAWQKFFAAGQVRSTPQGLCEWTHPRASVKYERSRVGKLSAHEKSRPLRSGSLFILPWKFTQLLPSRCFLPWLPI